jgi:hypothetical protein
LPIGLSHRLGDGNVVVLLDGGRVTAAGGMEVLDAATADLMA